MNHQYIPDWSSSMGDTFAPLGGGEDDGLIELMWCNGHVVMQSQQAAPRKPPRHDKDDGEAAAAQAWFQDPLERDDLFSELFCEAQAAVDGGRVGGSGMMPPPPPWEKACTPGDDGAAARTSTATDGGESSMLTIGSSFCDAATPPPPGAAKDTVSSSATRSRSCTTRSEQPGPGPGAAVATPAHRSGKRKQSDATDAEDLEFESADVTCERAHKIKMTTAKRRRAAEVHNLSERRRRDRINEKMKALQDLIPHCNKTDKASMLDEAIEYLKSLQLQLQMMWMGGGMAAAFPAGVHQYMQRMVAGPLPPPHVASMPFMAPPVPDLYARYLAVDHPPTPALVPPPYTVQNQQHCLQATMGFYQRQNHHHHPALLPLPPLPPPASVPAASPSDGIMHKKYENRGKPEIQGRMMG